MSRANFVEAEEEEERGSVRVKDRDVFFFYQNSFFFIVVDIVRKS